MKKRIYVILSVLILSMVFLNGCGISMVKNGEGGNSSNGSGGGDQAAAESKVLDGPEYTCTMSIVCDMILAHKEDLKKEKEEFLPEDGVVLDSTEVTFHEGETAFDLLQRVCQEKDIQMESNYTPMYKSYYVEGIHQIYEFDCGPNSGWMYQVNGEYPNYGASSYQVKEGDEIIWEYTCNLGSDLGTETK